MTSIRTDEQIFHSKFSKNLMTLYSARRKINIQINMALRKDDSHSVMLYTNIYLLIYTSWSEAALVKLVHTPFGFSKSEKKKILKDRDVLNKWRKCVNTAFTKFRKQGSEIPNKKKKIKNLVEAYLKTQGQIRNKIAHGQWEYPLYSNNLSHNPDVLVWLKTIDVIQIDTWFEIHKELIEIVRGLIDSRQRNNHKAHYNEYFTRLTNIEIIIDKRKKWTLEEKKRRLKLKPIKK
jgi:hypothetical protein